MWEGESPALIQCAREPGDRPSYVICEHRGGRLVRCCRFWSVREENTPSGLNILPANSPSPFSAPGSHAFSKHASRVHNMGKNRMKGILQFAAACGLIAASIGSAQAQSDSSLDEVTVTAKRLEEEIPQQLAQYGTHLDVITAAQIKNGGYIDVASALEALAPALYISSKNGPFDYVQVSLQGSRTEDVLWLVDGIRINNRLYAGTTPLDTIPASMIERIEVLDGGQALFYGTQAVAGAINIVTKSFSDHPDGAVSVGGDSNNGKQVQGYFRDTIGSNHFVAYALHDESTGIHPLPDADYQPTGTNRFLPYKVTTVGGKYAYDFTDSLTLSASYQHTNANLDFAQPMLTANAFNQRNEDLVSARLDYTPSDEFKFYV